MAEGIAILTRHAGLTLRPYRPGDEEGILALFRRAYGKERSLAGWRWKFCDNPAGQQIMLAVTEAGEVVGQYAGLPVWAAKGGRLFLFSQAVDSMVDPRFRRGLQNPGLQITLTRRFFEEYMGPGKGAIAYGFPIPVYCGLLVRTGTSTVVHKVMQLKRELTRGEEAPGGALTSLRYRVEQAPRFPQAVDELWERCQQELPLAIIRDARFLNWRYADCPDVTYVKLLATDRWTARLAGLAVLRLGIDGRPAALLVDWLVPERRRGLASVLLQHCHALASASGLSQMEAWFPEYAPQFQFLQTHGYQPTATMYALIATVFCEELSQEWMRGHWYYTMGDSDIY